MTVIVDPRTGALVETENEKIQLDAMVRVFTRLGARSLYPGFGTALFDAIRVPSEENFAGLRSRLQAALRDSPYYTLVETRVAQEGEDLNIELVVRDRSGQTQTVAATP